MTDYEINTLLCRALRIPLDAIEAVIRLRVGRLPEIVVTTDAVVSADTEALELVQRHFELVPREPRAQSQETTE